MQLALFFVIAISIASAAPHGKIVPAARTVLFEQSEDGPRSTARCTFTVRTPHLLACFERGGVVTFVALDDEKSERFTMRFAGAGQSPPPVGERPVNGPTVYITHEQLLPSSPRTFEAVRYRRIYPGIDVVFYAAGEHLEYDIEIARGADPRNIKIAFDGASAHLTGDGSLIVKVGALQGFHTRPVAYEVAGGGKRVPVRASYLRDRHGLVRFRTPPRLGQKAERLVLDPVVNFARLIGGSGVDTIRALALDSGGNIYVAGDTDSVIVGFPPEVTERRNDRAGWIAKLDPAGSQMLYRVFIDGAGNDFINSLHVTTDGVVYAAGTTGSPQLAGFSGNAADLEDAFLLKVNAGGAVEYGRYIGGAHPDRAWGIAVGPDGVVIVGSTSSADLPSRVNAYRGGMSDCFVARLSIATGGLQNTTYIGGTGSDSCNAVATGSAAQMYYVSGTTDSVDLPVSAGAVQGSIAGSTDAFAARITAAGSILSMTYLGGGAPDTASSVAVDPVSGNLWIAGSTASVDFTTTPTAIQGSSLGGYDGFVSKLSPDFGSLLYSSRIGGLGDDEITALAPGLTGEVAVAGSTNSSDLPVSDPLHGFMGDRDGFISVLHPRLAQPPLLTYVGGAGDDRAAAVQFCSTALLCVAGLSNSLVFLDTASGNNNYNGFTTKLTYSAAPVVEQRAMFLQNEATNAVSIWGMGGAQGTSVLYAPVVHTARAGWKLKAAGDFNRDGVSDMVFQNETSRQVSIWYMGGVSGLVLQSAPVLLTAAPSWNVVAAADMDRNGTPDLILQNQVSNALSVWYLAGPEGKTLLSTPVVGTPASGWRVIAAGDFDQNGTSDLVLQHSTNNAVSIWYLGGTSGTTIVKAPIVYYARTGWKVMGAADMNRDGVTDLVLQNEQSNTVSIWYLGGSDGSTLVSAPVVMNAAAGWKIRSAQ